MYTSKDQMEEEKEKTSIKYAVVRQGLRCSLL